MITFGISILVIVYGSFRSLSMDRNIVADEDKIGLLDAGSDDGSAEKINIFEVTQFKHFRLL